MAANHFQFMYKHASLYSSTQNNNGSTLAKFNSNAYKDAEQNKRNHEIYIITSNNHFKIFILRLLVKKRKEIKQYNDLRIITQHFLLLSIHISPLNEPETEQPYKTNTLFSFNIVLCV